MPDEIPENDWVTLAGKAFGMSQTEMLHAALSFCDDAIAAGTHDIPDRKTIIAWGFRKRSVRLTRKSRAFLKMLCDHLEQHHPVLRPSVLKTVQEHLSRESRSKALTRDESKNILSKLYGYTIDAGDLVPLFKHHQSGYYFMYRRSERDENIIVEMLILLPASRHAIRAHLINEHLQVFSGYAYPAVDSVYILLIKTHLKARFRMRALFLSYPPTEVGHDSFQGVITRISDRKHGPTSSIVVLERAKEVESIKRSVDILIEKRNLTLLDGGSQRELESLFNNARSSATLRQSSLQKLLGAPLIVSAAAQSWH